MPRSGAPTPAHRQTRVLLTAVFLAYLAQMTLGPVIAPLSREVGLPEWQVGAVISVAAIMVVVTSQRWGRLSQSWGRKPVLVAALASAALAMALFAGAVGLGMDGVLTGTALFVAFVALRGVGFGTAIAAILPTAQAYLADVTRDEQTRVTGIAALGATQGMAMVGGSSVGGALFAVGLIAPIILVPVLLAVGLLLVLTQLRAEAPTELIANPARVKPTDPRVWPFLLVGFGMFTALGFVQVIAGFIVQDRLGLDARQTAMVTGGALLVTGLGFVVAQSVIVPRTGWAPPMLLRTGGLLALAGFATLVPDGGPVTLFVALSLIGVGLGIAMPGYAAGPTLLVSRAEQGGLAGLIGATNALTFVVAPTASTALYDLWAPLPVIVATVAMAAVAVLVFTHPRLARTPAPAPLPEPA